MSDITVQHLIEFVQRPEETPVIIEETGEKEGTVILPIGSVPGIGARTTAVYMAQVIAESERTAKIIHIDLNITSPGIENFYFPDPSKIQMNLDLIYQKAKKGIITGEQIEKNSIVSKRNENIFVIPGTRNHLVADAFDDRVLQAIIKAARQHFDYIFISCSSDLDNPGTVAALLEADHILYVSSGDTGEVRILNERLNQLFRPQMPHLVEKMKIIHVDKDPMFKDAESNIKTTDLFFIGKIPYLPGLLKMKNAGGVLRGKEAEFYLLAIERTLHKLGFIRKSEAISIEKNWMSWFTQLFSKRKEA